MSGNESYYSSPANEGGHPESHVNTTLYDLINKIDQQEQDIYICLSCVED